MSKNKPKTRQLDWEEEQGRKIKLNQEKCRHKYKTIQMLDFLNDEILFESVCFKCGSPSY